MTSTSTMLRSVGARLSVVTALVAAFALLFVGGAAAQSDEDCYPVPVDGCEEPEVQPSVTESPDPAPEPTREVDNQSDDSDDDEEAALASTGIESPVLGAIAAGLVAAGAGAVVVARRRQAVDA